MTSVPNGSPGTPVVPRRAVVLGLALAAAAPVSQAALQSPAPVQPVPGPEEQRAIALIHAWVAAMMAKDADKVLSLMDEECQYRDDPFQKESKKGRALLLQDLGKLLGGLASMKIDAAYAVGSPKDDVLVLVRRTDVFNLFGKQVTMPMGAYYRVRNGRILEWLDTPLAEMPPPPAR